MAAFNGLVLERPYDEIRVADIIAGADVGRSTFYEHFRNKDEVLRHVVAGLMTILADAVTESGDAERIGRLLEHVWMNRRAARALLRGSSAGPVGDLLAELIEARLAEACRRGGHELVIPVRLAAGHLAAAQLALLRGWLGGIGPCPGAALATALLASTRGAVSALRREA